MSGMSDVRLALHSQELEAGQARTLSAPANGCWSMFWHRRHTRKALLELTAEQLHDIGISAERARQEGIKPFWRG